MQPLSIWSLLACSHSLSLTFSLFLFSLLLFFFFFSLIYFLSLSLFHFSPFFLFFLARQNQHHPWYEMNLLRGANRSPPTWIFVPYDTESKCVMSVSPSIFLQLEVPGVQLVQFSCPRASYASCPENG